MRGQHKGFVVCEYSGIEVLSTPPELTYEQLQDTANWPKDFKATPLFERDSLREGDTVMLASLAGGYALYTVKSHEGGLSGMSGDMVAFFEFGQDARQCWVCFSIGNLKAIQKRTLER